MMVLMAAHVVAGNSNERIASHGLVTPASVIVPSNPVTIDTPAAVLVMTKGDPGKAMHESPTVVSHAVLVVDEAENEVNTKSIPRIVRN
jgi:hypothetical protein